MTYGKEAKEKKHALQTSKQLSMEKENKLKRVSVLVSCTACTVDSCIAQVYLFYQLSLPLLKRLLLISIYIQATWVTFFNIFCIAPKQETKRHKSNLMWIRLLNSLPRGRF